MIGVAEEMKVPGRRLNARRQGDSAGSTQVEVLNAAKASLQEHNETASEEMVNGLGAWRIIWIHFFR